MKVYILMMEEFPGVSLFNVYSNLEEAQKERDHWVKNIHPPMYKDMWIDEWECLGKFVDDGLCASPSRKDL